jgi:hypothetical protein
MTNLHTVIAAEKHVKSRAHSEISEFYKIIQKPVLFSGQVRTYQRKDEDGEDFPQERQHIQLHLSTVIDALQSEYEKLINITAQKDIANQEAKASVLVDGTEILPELPITTLLFLEKTLTDMRSFFEKAPLLDGAEVWTYDLDSGVHKSEPTRTHRTRKTQRPIVLYDATDKHPAQTQLITEDEVVGYWSTQKVSTAMPVTQKKKILEKIDLLLRGVKDARERANDTEVTEKPLVAKKLFDFVLG